MSNKHDYKDMMTPKTNVYDELIDSVNDSDNANLPDNVEVDVMSIPVAKRKKSIRETHKTKAFYIRNDIAKQIDKDIRNSRRGAMTEIVNALFEEYYKSQGRL